MKQHRGAKRSIGCCQQIFKEEAYSIHISTINYLYWTVNTLRRQTTAEQRLNRTHYKQYISIWTTFTGILYDTYGTFQVSLQTNIAVNRSSYWVFSNMSLLFSFPKNSGMFTAARVFLILSKRGVQVRPGLFLEAGIRIRIEVNSSIRIRIRFKVKI